MPFIELVGPIISSTSYVQGELVAKDASFTLPAATPKTAEMMAMGTWNIPIWQMLDEMEDSLTKMGIDKYLAKMVQPEPLDIEHRWVQLGIDENGNTRNVGCKAFLHVIPKGIPGGEITVGETTECATSYTVTRYRLIVDGDELWSIDRLTGLLKVNGKDYTQDINSML